MMNSVLTALAPDAEQAVATLCHQFGVEQLDLFGSAAEGRFDPARSDLDFVVAFRPERRADWRAYFDLREGLRALFGREVDLLSAQPIENPYLRRRVEARRERVYPPS